MSDLLRQHRPECHSYPLTIPTSVPYTIHASPQIVIAHRGASSHLPEHTLASYRLALELGADYIEPDLVSTKDHHLVAIHSIDLSITTNVESVFGITGIKNKTISKYKGNKNGLKDDEFGYWVYDFTLEEIKKLRVTQRLGNSSSEDNSGSSKRSTAFDGIFQIPTLIEILELLNEWNENIQPLWYNNNNIDGNNDKSSVILSTNSNNNNNKEEKKKNQHPHPKQPHHYPPPPRGIYAELKDFYWLLEDTNINLLDVLFDQITGTRSMTTTSTTNSSGNINNDDDDKKEEEEEEVKTQQQQQDVWKNALLKNMCDTKILFEHEYRLPPLVIQSFDVEVLKNFTHRWDQIALTENENEKSSLTYEVISSTVNNDNNESPIVYNIPLPTPPTILLISNDKCHDEKFWFHIEDNYRDYINGISPDKNCFFQTTISEKKNKDGEATPPSTKMLQLQYVPTIMEKAKENNWVVHPWTERPEKQFLITTDEGDDEVGSSKSSPFRSIIDELIYMKCTIGIHGIFSESVDIAVRVMNMPCRPTVDTIDSIDGIATTTSCPTTTTGSNNFINEIPIGPVILFSFVSGILTALMILKYCIGSSTSTSSSSSTAAVQQRPQQRRNGNRRRRTGHSVLPTTNTDDDDDNDDHDNDSIVDDNDDDNNEDYDDDDHVDTIRVVV